MEDLIKDTKLEEHKGIIQNLLTLLPSAINSSTSPERQFLPGILISLDQLSVHLIKLDHIFGMDLIRISTILTLISPTKLNMIEVIVKDTARDCLESLLVALIIHIKNQSVQN